ncbi:MAG: flagellar basal body-associated FliL family protein [Candidatus Puniceispirillaceae bacterium]
MANNSAREGGEITPLSGRARLGFIALLVGVVILVATLFFYGHSQFSASPHLANSALNERLAAARMAPEIADNISDVQADEIAGDEQMDSVDEEEEELQDLDGDGVIDFNGPEYRYYAFEAPFVSNLDNSSKLLTLELSLLIKRPAFFVDGELDDIIKLAPALRSRILTYLITLSPEGLKTRADRQRLARDIRLMLNEYLHADSENDEEGILEVQILKMVVA